MPSNEWRYVKFRPGKAHLWALTPGGVWRSRCARMCVIDLDVTTVSLPVENGAILKCKQCISSEIHRKEAT